MAANSLWFASMEASVRALASYGHWQGATAHWGQVEAAI